MEPAMGYVILFVLLAAPLAAMGAVVLAIATGLIHEPTPVQAAAQSYAASWRSADVRG